MSFMFILQYIIEFLKGWSHYKPLVFEQKRAESGLYVGTGFDTIHFLYCKSADEEEFTYRIQYNIYIG